MYHKIWPYKVYYVRFSAFKYLIRVLRKKTLEGQEIEDVFDYVFVFLIKKILYKIYF